MDVAELGIQLTQVVQFAVLSVNHLLYPLDLDVLSRKELGEVEETRLVFGFTVVAIGNLAL